MRGSERSALSLEQSSLAPARAYSWILVATILASSMVFIDSTAVNLALPVLQRDLHASNAQVQWVIEAYSLLLSALILVGGSLGDRLGRRRVFLWGVAGFALASLLCAIVQTANELVAARALQGLASAFLTPGSLAILGASFDEEQRGKAVGTWSSLGALTAIAGPLIGGFIVQHASWRWIFFINPPFALLVVLISLRWVPESRDAELEHGVDWYGAILATAGLGAVVWGLIAAGASGWSTLEIVVCCAGVAMLVAFVAVEARVPAPMMPLGLFRSHTFSAVNLQTLLLYAALGGATFLLPFNLILIQHYSPTAAGAAFLPFIVLISALSPWIGGLSRKTGARILLLVGPIVVACGFLGLAHQSIGGSYWQTFFLPTVVFGLGMAMVVAPLTTTVLDSVGKEHFGIASGINNAVARTAGLLAVATLSLVLSGAFNRELDRRLAQIAPPTPIVAQMDAQRPKLAAAQVPKTASPALRAQLESAIATSYVAGFRQAMWLAAGLSIAASLCALALPTRTY